MSADLTVSEAERLDACEQVIERGLATFVDVGAALLEVRDSRLYRMAYPTFEAYCAERWNMVASRARQLIAAANTVGNLLTVTTVTPANEAQARELMGLSPEAQREVWQAAVETAPDGKITAVHVRALARISEALSAAPDPVREVVERYGVADADTISELTRLHKQKAETFAEVAASGWIQPGDEEAAVRIDAGALKVREALRDKAQTHRLLAADERRESTRCPNCGFSF